MATGGMTISHGQVLHLAQKCPLLRWPSDNGGLR